MTNEITLQLWFLILCGVGIFVVALLACLLIVALVNYKWKKQYLKLHNDLKLAILKENSELRDTLHDEGIFKEHLRQDLDKAVKILKVRYKSVDNELTELKIYNKSIPILTERFESYKDWLYPTPVGESTDIPLPADEPEPTFETEE